ncbi:hypothetical protein BJ875DRAFT_40012 [Amylocarpus encephaloides]|uniref:2EXR domain-containing protein n=1 Tax=Amylocarpus encephaloides TaxID=45428 RepID=A0A9P8C9I1_9HELO|nr:hypothetical protein BJ875DRAFT_40012 [Amylocarpus encephaloides]
MPNSSTPTSFHLFPSLVPELRLKIWRHACESPRTVTVRYDLERDHCLTTSRPPSVLQACHESREETLKIIRLYFGTHTSPPTTYFNPYQDTLYLPRHREMGYDDTLRDFRKLVRDDEGALDEIKRVAIDSVDLDIKRPWESYNKASFLRGFSNLEEVILVMPGDKIRLEEHVEFVSARDDTEKLLRTWVTFRQAFNMEETMLERMCNDMGRDYQLWTLPTVRLRAKTRARVQRKSIDVEETVAKLSGLMM